MKNFLLFLFLLFSVTEMYSQSTITITSPNGGEIWQLGWTKNITWTSSGVSGNVSIEIVDNIGASFNPQRFIVQNISNSGIYPWSIPSNFSPFENYKIKIFSVNTPATFDLSNNGFSIVKLDLIEPDGNEFWQVGVNKDIEWDSEFISNIKIEYTTNNGNSWNTIAASFPAATEIYQWNIPNTPSVNCKVRISSVSNSEINDLSSQIFTISRLELTSPNGGENWQSGQQKNITWTSSEITNVKLEYTSDNGSSWNVISASTSAAAGSFLWTPSTPSSNYKIRISDAARPEIIDNSENIFTISSLVITSPNGSESWQAGSVQAVTWTSGFIDNVKIEYTSDNGQTWNNVVLSVPANQASYNWTVPNNASTQCKVKISSVSNPDIYDLSNNTFTILPLNSITVETPNGGESWKIGTNQDIRWNYMNISNVKIEYSTDNGNTWKPIINSVTAANRVYNWNPIPNEPSTTCKIKISDAAQSSTFDESNNTFIISSLNLTAPDGGNKLQVGSSHNITWDYNNISNVKIEYTTDNGTSWSTITSSYPAVSRTYSWTIPNSPSSNCKVKISDAEHLNVTDISQSAFTIASLRINSPNGDENWLVNSTQSILWDKNLVSNVRVFLSTNNGSTWTIEVPQNTINQNANTANWIIPNNPSNLCKIKVEDASDASIYDVSDNTFIISRLRLTSPNGGESLLTGQTQVINWDRSDNINNVKLEYSTNNGTSWNTIVNSIDASSLNYHWTVPNITTTQCLIRISNVAASQIFDISDNVFTISKAINVTSPNGLEQWIVGTKHNITWNTTVGNVRIDYSADNGTNWILVAAPVAGNAGSYQWTVPYNISAACKVKISDITNLNNYDESDTTFKITQSASITVTSPGLNDKFQAGMAKDIQWQSTNVTNVRIEYSTNNGVTWNSITSTTPSDGSYQWLVPGFSSNQCKIRISDAANSSIFNESEIFIIPYLKVLLPNGSENWLIDSVYTIRWDAVNVSSFQFFISRNNGISWTDITASLTNITTSSAMWEVDAPISSQCKIKICDSVDPAVYDTSKDVFTISQLKLLSPIGGENWQAGTQAPITWKSNSSGNVIVEYSSNGGSTWTNIVTVAGNIGTCNWNVPAGTSNQYKVRIRDAQSQALIDESSSFFTVSNLTLTSPTLGTEKWYIGSVQAIKWTSTYISRVKIQYSVNNGVDWTDIETNYPSAGVYSWTIPNVPSTQCKVRIASVDNNCTTNDVSDNVFTIAPTLKVLTPNGNENWQVGTKQNITWTFDNSDNPISNVKIEYSTNNGSTWAVAVASVGAATGTYSWTIPNSPSSACKVRVSDVTKPSSNDISDAVFTISTLSVVSPNGGESFQADSVRKITWSCNYVDEINIEYSTNNGTGWNVIATSVSAAAKIYNWVVPNSPSTQCKIRIINSKNLENFDVSDNVFTISSLRLISPNGGEVWQSGQTKSISWTSSNVSNIKLEYSSNNGASWNIIAATTSASSGNYNWIIPNAASSQCKVRISDAAKPDVYDISNSTFIISSITLVTPNGGEIWQAEKSQLITWNNSTDISEVKLEYSTNNGTSWNLINASVPAIEGIYNWTLPGISSTQCKIKISPVANPSIFDISDNNFTISSLKIVSPNGGENFQVGQTRNITWTSANLTNVKLEYSTNNGSSWFVITASTPANSGTFSWTIPNTPSNVCKLRISDVTKPEINDLGDNNFIISIKTTIQVTSPNGDENWQAGSRKNLTWISENVSSVKIEYSINNGVEWILVASPVVSTGTYEWIIPNNPSFQCRVKVTDLYNMEVFDISDKNFTISNLELTQPDNFEKWLAGSKKNITWTCQNVANIKIEYSVDNGINWLGVAPSVSAATGSYNWTIPNTLSSNCKIKLSDALKPEVCDISTNTFSITPIELISPAGEESWKAKTLQRIIWDCIPDIKQIKIEYSSNNGIHWTTVITSTPAGNKIFDWKVPNHPSAECLVRISDTANSNFNDLSRKFFSILINPEINITTPNGGEILLAGANFPISWSSEYISNVDLYYSINNGMSWISIEDSVQSTGIYNWLVPEINSVQCKLKICSSGQQDIEDISDSLFVIKYVSSVSDKLKVKPNSFELFQNYPNPFNPSTKIWYSVSELSKVDIRVYNSLGKEIAILVNEDKSVGNHVVTFNADNLPCGVYFYRMTAGSYSDTKKFILLK